MVSCILAVICGIFIIAADQLSKLYIISNYSLGESSEFINGLIDIVYIHNRGAAWGMLSGKTWILIILTLVIMLACVIFLIKIGTKNKLLFWSLIVVVSGGIGNIIDRVFRDGNVIDFLHFEFWPQFPIFNVADCAIVIGAGLLLLHFIVDAYKEAKNKKDGQIKNA